MQKDNKKWVKVALVTGGVGKGSAAGTLASSALNEASIVAETRERENFEKFLLLTKLLWWINGNAESKRNLKEREEWVVGMRLR